MRIHIFMLLAAPTFAGCLPVPGDRIVAGDLAVAIPKFGQLDPALPLGFAPMVGTRRVFRVHELDALARRFGLNDGLTNHDICFEREAKPLTDGAIQAAVALAFDLPSEKVEVLDFLRAPLPVGQLDFPKAQAKSLLQGPKEQLVSGLFLCHGVLSPATGRSYPVWAKVRVSIARVVAFSSVSLSKGHVIAEQDLKFSEVQNGYTSVQVVTTLDQAVGKVLKLPVSAGEPIRLGALEQLREVRAGDTVKVDVSSGPAHLRFEAPARSSGRTGDSVLVTNPLTGRVFRAVVTAMGTVEVRTSVVDGAGSR